MRPALIDGEPVSYPLANGQNWVLPEALLTRYSKRFGAEVDVTEELLKAQDWTVDHPGNRKTPRGMSGFLTRWMGGAVRRARAGVTLPRHRGRPDMHVGGHGLPAPEVDEALATLAARVRASRAAEAGLRAVLENLARSIEALSPAAPPAVLQQTLDQLEETALHAILAALPRQDVEAMERKAGSAAGNGVSPEVAERARKSLLARQVREALGLPRLELG